MHQTFGMGCLLLLDHAVANEQARHHENQQHSDDSQLPHHMIPACPPHHLPLRRSPVLLLRQPADLQPLQQRRQLPVLRAGIPYRRSIRQQQFRPASPSFLLLAGQPLPYRVNQIIVGQLVVFLPRLRLENGVAACLLSFGVGRRDEANFVVENADQVIEVPGTTSVATMLPAIRRKSACGP